MHTLSTLFRVGVTLAMIALPGFVLPVLWEKAIWFYALHEDLEQKSIHTSSLWADYWTHFVVLRLSVSSVLMVAVVASVWVRPLKVSDAVCSLAIFLSSCGIACFAMGLMMAIPF